MRRPAVGVGHTFGMSSEMSLSRSELAAAVGERLGRPVYLDGWRPPVQGAVGHVFGLSDGDCRYVAKVFPAVSELPAKTEPVALRLAAWTGVPVPVLVLDGFLPTAGMWFVLSQRLPGLRWSDRRPELDAGSRADVQSQVARLLRKLHALKGLVFGSLIDGGPRWAEAWPSLLAHADAATTGYVSAGGSETIAVAVRVLIRRSRELYAAPFPAALCHHDVNGGNVLVTASGPPRLSGLVDLERASWDDPMRDLALTCLHVRYFDPDAVAGLIAAYGVQTEAEIRRLHLHQMLLAMTERTWIITDQPQQWRRSAAALDRLLSDMLQGLV